MKSDISKEDLYESVKALVECEKPHIHLDQHKLFTLFSIAFQYILFLSTKNPGAYIIRIEDSALADKFARKSKDSSTRKFMQSLMVPRKLKFKKSMFFLDFFHIGSWNLTKDIDPTKIKGAIIVKNTGSKPMEFTDTEEGEVDIMASLPKDYFHTSLTDFVPKTITIAYEHEFENVEILNFPFIKQDVVQTISGVTIGKDIDWDKLDD
ncbi:hypothetical protein A9Q84_03165 [Halobacteriovorax marinus]|uniref:Uncharacterized protein n=1 Tax=Halobacteriovorax marinus TaxID=97084 RepID=A0A1Y5FD94_9BACT|nr:hypothetical protein A9Q84_03165 [Halobacteriovorax marinus]